MDQRDTEIMAVHRAAARMDDADDTCLTVAMENAEIDRIVANYARWELEDGPEIVPDPVEPSVLDSFDVIFGVDTEYVSARNVPHAPAKLKHDDRNIILSYQC